MSQSRRGEPPITINQITGRASGFPRIVGILLLIVVPLIVISLFMSGSTVQAGHVGVLLTFGRVEDKVLPPGFHVILPGAQRIVQVETRVLPHAFKEIDAASSELQTVKLTGTMNYHLETTKAPQLYQEVGLDFAERVIDPAFNDFIKEVVPRYPVTEILVKRDEMRNRAKEMLGQNLQRYGIVVDDIYISNISFSKEYQDAIEKKQTAQQNVEAERQILAQKEVQAQQNIIDAKGKADARIATAEGEAKANEVLTLSLSPQLIDYTRWTRWDGKLPLVSSEAQPLLSIPLQSAPTPTAPR
jgi:prohibitin 2